MRSSLENCMKVAPSYEHEFKIMKVVLNYKYPDEDLVVSGTSVA